MEVNALPLASVTNPNHDDGVCTRVNLYNEWVTSVPKTARLPGGNLAGATPTPINRNDAVIAEIKTIEIDFEYVPMN